MSKISARRLALSLAVLFLASTVLGQEAQRKTPLPTMPKTDCEPDNCISKVMYLPNFSTPYELQNVANMFRVIAEIKQVDQNPSEHTISLKGTAEQLAIAEKLVSVSESLRSSGSHNPSSVLVYQLKPSRPEPSVSEKAPGNSSVATWTSCELNTCFIKVLYLPDFATTVELQDAANMFRTIADIRLICPDPSGHAISLKGTAEQLAIAERLVSVLESLQSSNGRNRSFVLVYELKGSLPEPAVSEKVSEQTILSMRKTICELTTCFIKVLYLPDFTTVQLQDTINRVRTTTQITHILPSQSRHLLVIRGTSEQVALTEKLANE